MKLTLLFLILGCSSGFAEGCRSEFNVLKECNKKHETDPDHWICYKTEDEDNNCKGQDSTFYQCGKLKVCEFYSASGLDYTPPQIPAKRPGVNR